MYKDELKAGYNPLQGKRLYLSGPIEHDSLGENWRKKPTKVFTEEFGLDLLDPNADEKQEWAAKLLEARENSDYETMRCIARSFTRKDLCWVDRCDFLVAYLPYGIPTTGTCHEIINSNNAKKPTLLVTNREDIAYLPLWYFGFIPIEFMFSGWDTLFQYLREVNSGAHKHNDRWNYVYGVI